MYDNTAVAVIPSPPETNADPDASSGQCMMSSRSISCPPLESGRPWMFDSSEVARCSDEPGYIQCHEFVFLVAAPGALKSEEPRPRAPQSKLTPALHPHTTVTVSPDLPPSRTLGGWGAPAFSVEPLGAAVFVEADQSSRVRGVLQHRCHFALSSGGEPAAGQ